MQRCSTCGYDRASGLRCTQCGSGFPQHETAAETPAPVPQLGLWSLRHLSVGGSVYWRTALLEGMAAVLSVTLWPGRIGGALLPLVLSPLIHDWATKAVLRHRYGVAIRRFIGFQLSGTLLFALGTLWLVFGVAMAGALSLLLAHGPALSPRGWTIALVAVGLAALTVPIFAYGYAAHTAVRRRAGFELFGAISFLMSLGALLLRY
jgi:hypothetical protein